MDIGAFIASYFFIILLVDGLLALIPAYIAKEKGRSFGAFWALGFFATVLVGLVAVLAMPPATSRVARLDADLFESNGRFVTEFPDEAKCPRCAEFIKFEAKVCRYCGADVSKHFGKIAAEITQNRDEKIALREKREADERVAEEAFLQAQRDRRSAGRMRVRKMLGNPLTWLAVVSVVAGVIGVTLWQISSNQQLAVSREDVIKGLGDSCPGSVAQTGDYWSWRGNSTSAPEIFLCVQDYLRKAGAGVFPLVDLDLSTSATVVRNFNQGEFKVDFARNRYGTADGTIDLFVHFRATPMLK